MPFYGFDEDGRLRGPPTEADKARAVTLLQQAQQRRRQVPEAMWSVSHPAYDAYSDAVIEARYSLGQGGLFSYCKAERRRESWNSVCWRGMIVQGTVRRKKDEKEAVANMEKEQKAKLAMEQAGNITTEAGHEDTIERMCGDVKEMSMKG